MKLKLPSKIQLTKKQNPLFFAVLLCLVTSCASNNSAFSDIEKSNCYQQPDFQYSPSDLPPKLVLQNINPVLLENLSFESINAANATGLLDLLTEYVQLKNSEQSAERRLALLELQQKISQQISISSLQISSVATELDCETKRINQIANFLITRADDRERNLVMSSIAVGAVGAIGSELLNNEPRAGKSGSYVAIGGAVVGTAFGIMMLTNKTKVPLTHKRNTLREIWEGPETSVTLPPSIWYFLNYKDPINRKESLREFLVKSWVAYGQTQTKNNKNSSGNTEIYFGDGGKYSGDELKNRADMYDQLESIIGLMMQDLKTLTIEIYQMK